MILGFFDLETTSVNVREARIIEWALVRYCLEEKQIVSIDTQLVRLPDTMHLSKEIQELTGISDSMLEKHGMDRVVSFPMLQGLLKSCDYLVAHNGLAYDKQVLETEFTAAAFDVPDKPWIDTMFDLPYPPNIGTRKLSYLAAEHGFLNPMAHRALSDCITLWRITTSYDWDLVRATAATPVVEIRADVKFAEREKAKKANYRWDGERKIWSKTIRRAFLAAEKAAVDFPVLEL